MIQMNKIKRNKVILVYNDEAGNISEESIWVQPSDPYFIVDNIPFFAPNIALNDIIKAELDDGQLYFEDLVKASGNSTIQVIFFHNGKTKEFINFLDLNECQWEGYENEKMISINIPPKVDYKLIKAKLDSLLAQGVLDYKEACIA